MTIVRRFIVPPGRTPVVPRQAVLPRDRLHPEAPAGRHTSVRRHRESLLSEILAGKTGVATRVAHSACFSAQNSSKHVPRSQDYSGNTMREPTLKSRRERTFMAVRTLCSAVREEVIRGRHYDETALCCAPVRDWHRNHCGSSSDRHWPGPPAQSDGTAEQELFDFHGRDRRPSWRISRRRHHRPRPLDWTTKRPR